MSSANNLVLKRDAGIFTFRSGNFYFLTPVNGKVTGAVFLGDASLSLTPTLSSEKRSISLLTKEPTLNEDFSSAIIRFTDGTYDEIVKAAGVSKGTPAGLSELNDINNALKKKIYYNLTGRLLQDVMSSERGGAFFAFINGRKFNSKEIFAVDPHGALGMEPEEVVFRTWDENKYGTWAAFHYAHEYKDGTASGTQQNGVIDMQHHLLETQFERSGKVSGDATTTFLVLKSGTKVVPFDLYSSLRVTSVTGKNGEALDFIQEDKDQDSDFYVILPEELSAGETYTIRTIYAGKDAVSNEGGGNYYPIARHNWYPNNGLKDYATYDLRFRVPKSFKIAATGAKLKDVVEGDWNVTEWKSRTFQSVAGFNFGDFKTEKQQIAGTDFEIETYANPEIPDWLKGTEFSSTMSPPSMMKKAMAEAQLSIPLYTDYFGPTSFKHIAMTQQTAGNYGQAWPELIYMPLTSFLDTTQRFSIMGFDPKGYFTVVGPHEIAHQWWGHTVGWASYRDQWMSEGFSQLSASLFLQMTRDNKQFIKFWNDELESMTEKNRHGFRAIDVGPVTMGYRLSTSTSGYDITQNLIYPKGGYILHMIRMMMWDRANGDARFKNTMREFVKTYTNRPASTEDFKAMVEKHMAPEMDLDGNRKMDWFFDSYVYGTTLPSYKFEQNIANGSNGAVLNFKITQSKVPDNFKMPVPVYVELMDGKVTRLGSANMFGNHTVEQSVPLGQMKVKRAMLMYYNDVLGLIEK
ncbi:MAG TPA: M1 family aminopeptidase [Terriglobales bacterium]|nr:M1 family aminopeptidase [Terriglobales bacterium]